MKKYIVLALCSLFVSPLIAQFTGEEAAVKAAIEQMFDGMRAGDSSMISAVFHPEARLHTTYFNKEGFAQLKIGDLDGFLKQIGTPHDKVYDEKIWSYDIRVDDALASVWTEYTFYLGEEKSHCGVNTFQMVKIGSNWQILQITDTRRKGGCKTEMTDSETEINTLLDAWHLAAAKADEATFFGSMTADAIYIGTDASERWLRDELKDWSKKYFDRESAWSFKATERQVHLSDDGQYAWWNESLDTWMGICRGSGVLQLTTNGWKIKQYHLSVTVPNDKIQAFIDLVKG
ncbi:MAG: hypothetical protein DHS20C18_41540 [Saprospiraceae bacterium]|nr:MAG: hypothetical protein DHS20C18_41540 [Saprospiraceae bacterium]